LCLIKFFEKLYLNEFEEKLEESMNWKRAGKEYE